MRLAASACSRRERPNTRTCEQGVFAHVRMFACSRRIPASPLEAVLNRRIIACSGIRTTAVFARKTSLYLFSAKSTDRSLRLVLFAAFWSAKSGAKTDPPTKKAKRRGLTLAPGARLKGGFKGRWTAERVISDTTLSLLKPASYAGARAFSPHLFERLFCQAGVVRRGTRREAGATAALSLAAEKEQPKARAPGAGGWQRRPQARADSVLFAEPPQPLRRVFLRRKGLILLRPLNAGRRRLPRKATCGWFWRF